MVTKIIKQSESNSNGYKTARSDHPQVERMANMIVTQSWHRNMWLIWPQSRHVSGTQTSKRKCSHSTKPYIAHCRLHVPDISRVRKSNTCQPKSGNIEWPNYIWGDDCKTPDVSLVVILSDLFSGHGRTMMWNMITPLRFCTIMQPMQTLWYVPFSTWIASITESRADYDVNCSNQNHANCPMHWNKPRRSRQPAHCCKPWSHSLGPPTWKNRKRQVCQQCVSRMVVFAQLLRMPKTDGLNFSVTSKEAPEWTKQPIGPFGARTLQSFLHQIRFLFPSMNCRVLLNLKQLLDVCHQARQWEMTAFRRNFVTWRPETWPDWHTRFWSNFLSMAKKPLNIKGAGWPLLGSTEELCVIATHTDHCSFPATWEKQSTGHSDKNIMVCTRPTCRLSSLEDVQKFL